MCGIFGTLSHRDLRPPARERLEESARLLRHRGPDDSGAHVGPGIGLVHTRLALVDLNARSNQPMWDSSRRHCIVFNGEIYNHRELRRELEDDGVAFRTTSDTEVLLESFARRGVAETLPRLEGMFAFAFFDVDRQSLVLARDPFGIKPLHYHETTDAFSFASEVMAFRPWIEFEPDVPEICAYLQAFHGFKGPTTRGSFLRGVRTLPPGSLLTVARGESAAVARYRSPLDLWDPALGAELAALPDSALVDRVDAALHRSVEMQLIADAPIGLYASGGVDSSVVAAIANRHRSGLRLFHADVVGKLSEFGAARTLARHLALELDRVEVRDDDFIERMPRTIRHYEIPATGRPQSVPFLMVSDLVRSRGVKGVLSGEGSDECFFGYGRTVPSARELIGAMSGRFLRSRVPAPRLAPPRVEEEMLAHFDRAIEREELRDLARRARRTAADPRSLRSFELIAYHLRTLLHRNDRLGMAASVEARFPFLDSELVKLAINLPYRCKVRLSSALSDGSNPLVAGKWIVRAVADRYLPRELSRMKKKGFKVSAHRRMRIEPDAFADSCIADLFGYSRAELAFLMEHASDGLKQRLLQLSVWGDLFLRRETVESALVRLRRRVSMARAAPDARVSAGARDPAA